MKQISENYWLRPWQSLLLALMAVGLSGPAQSQEPRVIESVPYESPEIRGYPPDIQKIKDRGELIVGLYYKSRPPFFMKDQEGNRCGIDIDLAKGIAGRLGVEIKFNEDARSYEQLYEMAADGDKVDMVAAKFSMTFERAMRVRYSKPYITFRQAIIVNREFVAKHNIEDYPMDHLKSENGIIVGVRRKTSYVEFARELFKNAKIVDAPWDQIIAKVKNGIFQAVMRDEYEVMREIRQNPELAVYVSVYVLKDRKDHIAVAVPGDSVNLLACIDMYLLDAMPEVLTARDIIRKNEAWETKKQCPDN